jgi:hypothetical protein
LKSGLSGLFSFPGSEKENSSKDGGSATSSATATPASKNKRRISDTDDDDDDFSPKKKRKEKKAKPAANEPKKTPKKSDDVSRSAVADKPEAKPEAKSGEERHKKRDKERSSRKEREKPRGEQRKSKEREEKRKSASAPVTPLRPGNPIHRPEQKRAGEEISFKLASASAASTTASLITNDNSTEAIKKILNGDRVAAAEGSPAKPKPPSDRPSDRPLDRPSPFKMSSALTSGAHVERVKLFPRSMTSEAASPSKPVTPRKIVDFASSAASSAAVDVLGSIMSDMNSAMKK